MRCQQGAFRKVSSTPRGLLSPARDPSFICCHNEVKEGFFFFFFFFNNERLWQVVKAGNFRKLRRNNKLIFWPPAANCTTATACKHNSNSYVITSSKTSCLCLERFKYPLKLQCRGWRNILRLGTTCFFLLRLRSQSHQLQLVFPKEIFTSF